MQLLARPRKESAYKHWQKSGDGTDHYLFLIDANKFKSINDVYGHIQGDQALTRIAESLRSVCRDLPRRANIARYGGDEFVILAATDDPDALCRQIHERLAAVNAMDPVPYELTVSIGVTKAEIGTSLAEAIAEADKKMYQEKKLLVKE